MKKFVSVAITIALFVAPAMFGAAKRRAIASPIPKDELSITFVRANGGDAIGGNVDIGSIAHRNSRDWRTTRTIESVGVRIDGKRDAAPRYAVLRASLMNAGANITIRIDGITLGAMPVVIDTHAAIGATTPHRIEIEIPADAPEGALLTSIGWEAVTP